MPRYVRLTLPMFTASEEKKTQVWNSAFCDFTKGLQGQVETTSGDKQVLALPFETAGVCKKRAKCEFLMIIFDMLLHQGPEWKMIKEKADYKEPLFQFAKMFLKTF